MHCFFRMHPNISTYIWVAGLFLLRIIIENRLGIVKIIYCLLIYVLVVNVTYQSKLYKESNPTRQNKNKYADLRFSSAGGVKYTFRSCFFV